MDGAEVTILVDACPRGGTPGDLYVVEPELKSSEPTDGPQPALDAHTMNPVSVLFAAKAMGARLNKILLLGCEPQTFGPEEGCMGLSEPVALAVERAVPLLESVVKRILEGEWPLGTN
jgi:hydrogenase maturation protease